MTTLTILASIAIWLGVAFTAGVVGMLTKITVDEMLFEMRLRQAARKARLAMRTRKQK